MSERSVVICRVLTCGAVNRYEDGLADEETHGGRLRAVPQTTLDGHHRLRHDLPPQDPTADCRKRHGTVNWDREQR